MSASVPVSVVFDQVREIARLRGEVAGWRSLFETAQAQAEGREASLTDLLNSWVRESGVLEAERPEGAQALADRLRATLSEREGHLRAEIARLQAEVQKLRLSRLNRNDPR